MNYTKDDCEQMQKVLRYFFEKRDRMKMDNEIAQELEYTEERLEYWITQIGNFSENTKKICQEHTPWNCGNRSFYCDENTKIFIENGGFIKWYEDEQKKYSFHIPQTETMNNFRDNAIINQSKNSPNSIQHNIIEKNENDSNSSVKTAEVAGTFIGNIIGWISKIWAGCYLGWMLSATI